MPSVQTGEKQSHYMHRCVPMLVKEGKKQDQAVAQCLGMFREHWKAKGSVLPEDVNDPVFVEALANFSWDDCPDCLKMEQAIQKSHGIFEIDMATARVSTKCDNCKETIDITKPKTPKKGPDGKPAKPKINPSIEATLETGLDTGETKQFHFCDEECLRQYLNKRNKTK